MGGKELEIISVYYFFKEFDYYGNQRGYINIQSFLELREDIGLYKVFVLICEKFE